MAFEIMTIGQLADYLQMNEQTIYKKAQKGQIPGSKIGNRWRFQKKIIDQWLMDSRVRSKKVPVAM